MGTSQERPNTFRADVGRGGDGWLVCYQSGNETGIYCEIPGGRHPGRARERALRIAAALNLVDTIDTSELERYVRESNVIIPTTKVEPLEATGTETGR